MDFGGSVLDDVVPSSLAQLSLLDYLNFDGANFADPLPSTLFLLTTLKHLHLNFILADTQIFPSGIGLLTQLIDLDIGNNEWTSKEVNLC